MTDNNTSLSAEMQAANESNPQAPVKILHVPTKGIEVSFDRSKIKWGSLVKLYAIKDDPSKQDETMGLINAILSSAVGQNVDDMPAYVVSELMLELKSMAGMRGDSEKN